jgi:hypothetical protein
MKLIKTINQYAVVTYGMLFHQQFAFGVPFKHLKLTTTNRFGEYITDKDMKGATQACKDTYKAWRQVKKKKNRKRIEKS